MVVHGLPNNSGDFMRAAGVGIGLVLYSAIAQRPTLTGRVAVALVIWHVNPLVTFPLLTSTARRTPPGYRARSADIEREDDPGVY